MLERRIRANRVLNVTTTPSLAELAWRVYPLAGDSDGLPLAAALHIHAAAHAARSASVADPTKRRHGGRERERGGDRVWC